MEIKFRAWDKVKREYVYSGVEYRMRCLMAPEYCSHCPKPCKVDTDYIGFPSNDECPVWDMEQYTGLTDKNGNKIFERDILQIPAFPSELNPMGETDMGVVERVAGAFGWRYLDHEGKASGRFESFISWVGETDTLDEEEVIGNIHEE